VKAIGALAERSAAPIGTAIGAGENGAATAVGVGLDALQTAVPALKPVVAGLELAGKVFSAVSAAAAKKIETFGSVAAAVAKGDLLSAQQAGLERQKMLDEAVPIVGGIINWWKGTSEKLAAISAVKNIQGAVEARAVSLAPFSGPLSGAMAGARAMKIQSDISLAATLGPQLAKATTAKSNYEAALNAALAPHLEKMAAELKNLYESGQVNAETAKKMEEALQDQTKLLELIKDDSAASKDLQKAIKDNLKKLREKGLEGGEFNAENIVEQLAGGVRFLNPLPLQDDPVLAPNFARQAMMRPLGGF
jgi:hypothetical protein